MMGWLREISRALFDALLAHWREPRRTRILGGSDALKRRVDDHIRLRSRPERDDEFGGPANRRRDE